MHPISRSLQGSANRRPFAFTRATRSMALALALCQLCGVCANAAESAGTVLLGSFRLHYGVKQNRPRWLVESSRTVPAGLQSGALPTADLSAAAADYLRRCGMTQDQIDQLVDLLTGE